MMIKTLLCTKTSSPLTYTAVTNLFFYPWAKELKDEMFKGLVRLRTHPDFIFHKKHNVARLFDFP